MKKNILLLQLLLSIVLGTYAQYPYQSINTSLLNQQWDAFWINHPSESPFDYGVYHFKKTFI